MAEVKPQVVQVMADTEKVTLRWCAPVADDNLAVFGPNGMYGTVTGKNGTVMVPKSEWSRFYDETARRLIESGGGTITPYGVVYDNGMKLEQVYDGRFFPATTMSRTPSPLR